MSTLKTAAFLAMACLIGAAISADRSEAALAANSLALNALTSNSVSGNSLTLNSIAGNSISGNSISGNSLASNRLEGNQAPAAGPSEADMAGMALNGVHLDSTSLVLPSAGH
jgi:hypothetical protein